tara:strand:+ start:13468 stop:13806 length:339 start_codon:yes stop_codon:yes gene_type:complete
MAKGDYTDSQRKTRYKTLVTTNTDTKVTVDTDEKRERAELLEMVEELFQDGNKSITADKLRAFLHIMVKSVQNSADDTVVDATTIANGRSLPTSDPRNPGKLWRDNGVVKVS